MKKTLAIVGAGRVGRALGRLLRQRGWRIGAVVARSKATARAAAKVIGAGRPQSSITAGLLETDVILICTPDAAVAAAADELAGVAGRASLRGKIVLHTSGAVSSSVLAPLARCGAWTGSMHPMQTFGRRSAPRLEGVIFGLEGDARAVRVAARMAGSLGGIAVRIPAKDKAAYHCAGGFAAQHVLAVMEAGIQMLLRVGFTRRQAFRALENLARQTLENLGAHGPRAAWTGPVARGDFATVARHVRVLRHFPAAFGRSYVELTRLAVALASPRPREVLRRLARLLKN